MALRPGSLPIGSISGPAETWFIAAGKCSAEGCAGGPYTFASQGELPPGMTLEPNTGRLTGTSTKLGTWKITITATDVNDPSETGSLTLDYSIFQTEAADGSSPSP